MIEITFLGRGGQGAFTSSKLLGTAASLYEGSYSLSFPTFGPERRGAPVFAYTKISQGPIRDRSQSMTSDYIVILDETLYNEKLVEQLKTKGKIIINTVHTEKYKGEQIIAFDAARLAETYLGLPITNTAMLGVLVAHTQIVSLESLMKAIEYHMTPGLAQKNKQLVEAICDAVKGA